jgi:hypothetical protein
MNSTSGSDALASGLGILFALAFYGAILALVIAIYYKIVSKAGYPGWYALLMLIPCVNFILLIMFAFQEWPIERELKQWRASGGGGAYPRYGQQYPPQYPPTGSPYDPPPQG